MKKLYPALFFVFGVFLTESVSAQVSSSNQTRFEWLDKKEGLSSNTVYAITQDHLGFVWMATSDGLNRFDGVDLKVFRHNPQDSSSLSTNHTKCLLLDSRQRLWVGTQLGGLNVYDYQTGKFRHFKHDKKDASSISNNEILSLREDHQGKIWVGTENGLNVFDPQTEQFTSYLHNPEDPTSISAKAILDVEVDYRGWIWAGTWDGGLNLLVPANEQKPEVTFRRFKLSDLPQAKHVWSLHADSYGKLWLGTLGGGLYMMDNIPMDASPSSVVPSFRSFIYSTDDSAQVADNSIFDVNEDEKGQIWVGTLNGISILPREELLNEMPRFTNIRNSETKPFALQDNILRCIFQDNQGIIWVGTHQGVGKFDSKLNKFERYYPELHLDVPLIIRGIVVDGEGNHWIAVDQVGLVGYRPNGEIIATIDEQKDLDGNYIQSMFLEGNELIVGLAEGIAIVDLEKKKLRRKVGIKAPKGIQLSRKNVRTILKDSRGQYWLGSEGGLILFDPSNDKMTFYIHEPTNPNSLSHSGVVDIKEDHLGQLWIATYGGLNCMKTQADGSRVFKHYKHSESPYSIGSNRINSLCFRGEELWMGTDDGLSRYLPSEDRFYNLDRTSGLPTSNLQSIWTDKQDNIWVASREGMFCHDPEAGMFTYYTEEDGLHSGRFYNNSFFVDQNGKVYITGKSGYTAFYPEQIRNNEEVPKIVLTDFRVYNKTVPLEKDIAILDTLRLSYKDNNLSFSFAALNFTRSDKNHYAYRLEGLDKDWIYCENKKQATYTNLPGGIYRFHVIGTNNDLVWNEQGTSLIVIVEPPYWETWWFRTLFVVGVLGSIVLYFVQRLRRVREQSRQLERMVKDRTREIKDQNTQIEELLVALRQKNENLEEKVEERTQNLKRSNEELKRSNYDLEQFAYIASHDLQEPLRMVGNFVQLLERKYGEKIDDNGREYIRYAVEGVTRMSDLIRNLLNYSRVGRDDINITVSDLNDIVGYKMVDLSHMIADTGADILMHDLPQNIACEPNQIGIVFYNLVGNALKFNQSDQAIVIIRSEEKENHWQFSITDNGIGIDGVFQDKVFQIFKRLNHRSDYEGTGIGLALCKRIVSRHKGDIWFESSSGNGTTFFFTIQKGLVRKEEEKGEEVLSF